MVIAVPAAAPAVCPGVRAVAVDQRVMLQVGPLLQDHAHAMHLIFAHFSTGGKMDVEAWLRFVDLFCIHPGILGRETVDKVFFQASGGIRLLAPMQFVHALVGLALSCYEKQWIVEFSVEKRARFQYKYKDAAKSRSEVHVCEMVDELLLAMNVDKPALLAARLGTPPAKPAGAVGAPGAAAKARPQTASATRPQLRPGSSGRGARVSLAATFSPNFGAAEQSRPMTAGMGAAPRAPMRTPSPRPTSAAAAPSPRARRLSANAPPQARAEMLDVELVAQAASGTRRSSPRRTRTSSSGGLALLVGGSAAGKQREPRPPSRQQLAQAQPARQQAPSPQRRPQPSSPHPASAAPRPPPDSLSLSLSLSGRAAADARTALPAEPPAQPPGDVRGDAASAAGLGSAAAAAAALAMDAPATDAVASPRARRGASPRERLLRTQLPAAFSQLRPGTAPPSARPGAAPSGAEEGARAPSPRSSLSAAAAPPAPLVRPSTAGRLTVTFAAEMAVVAAAAPLGPRAVVPRPPAAGRTSPRGRPLDGARLLEPSPPGTRPSTAIATGRPARPGLRVSSEARQAAPYAQPRPWALAATAPAQVQAAPSLAYQQAWAAATAPPSSTAPPDGTTTPNSSRSSTESESESSSSSSSHVEELLEQAKALIAQAHKPQASARLLPSTDYYTFSVDALGGALTARAGAFGSFAPRASVKRRGAGRSKSASFGQALAQGGFKMVFAAEGDRYSPSLGGSVPGPVTRRKLVVD